MCTLPNEKECNTISAPMRRVIKHSSNLVINTPSALLHASTGLNMINLFQCNIQNHISSFAARFNGSEILSDIYLYRLLLLQNALWITFSPFLLKDLSPWFFTSSFQKDIICRTIYFASLIDISFDPTNLPLPSGVVVPYPIHDYFRESPRIFAKQIPYLRKLSVSSLTQCVSPNGKHLLPFCAIVQKVAPDTRISRTTNWFTSLVKSVTQNDSLLTLKPDFIISAEFLPEPPSINIIPSDHPIYARSWLATWNESSNSVDFGRSLQIDHNNFEAIVVHWIPALRATASLTSAGPPKLTLVECPECHLNDPSILHTTY